MVVAIAKDDIRQVLAETLNEMTVTVSPKINCLVLASRGLALCIHEYGYRVCMGMCVCVCICDYYMCV